MTTKNLKYIEYTLKGFFAIFCILFFYFLFRKCIKYNEYTIYTITPIYSNTYDFKSIVGNEKILNKPYKKNLYINDKVYIENFENSSLYEPYKSRNFKGKENYYVTKVYEETFISSYLISAVKDEKNNDKTRRRTVVSGEYNYKTNDVVFGFNKDKTNFTIDTDVKTKQQADELNKSCLKNYWIRVIIFLILSLLTLISIILFPFLLKKKGTLNKKG